MSHPLDTPTPAGLAPCPELPALRSHALAAQAGAEDVTAALERMLRLQHHAPGALVFDEPVEPGAAIELTGFGPATIRTRVPASPLGVFLRSRGDEPVAPPRVRSIHIDADRRQLRVTWGHFRRYDTRRAPRFVVVKEAA
jgi:hypothetical protein